MSFWLADNSDSVHPVLTGSEATEAEAESEEKETLLIRRASDSDSVELPTPLPIFDLHWIVTLLALPIPTPSLVWTSPENLVAIIHIITDWQRSFLPMSCNINAFCIFHAHTSAIDQFIALNLWSFIKISFRHVKLWSPNFFFFFIIIFTPFVKQIYIYIYTNISRKNVEWRRAHWAHKTWQFYKEMYTRKH